MRTKLNLRGVLTLAVSFMLVVLMATLVLADDIGNSLDNDLDAVAEVMSLNVGGTEGATTLYVQPRNGDKKNGCNLTSNTTLVVSVVSSDESVATVAPASLTFTSCVDSENGLTITVNPHREGSATITVSQASNNTGATFNFEPATFTVNVTQPPNTPPQISISGVTGGSSYEIGSVPTATCEVEDAEDGNSSFPATLGPVNGTNFAYGVGSQEASCAYTDEGGLQAAASVTYSIVDTTGPALNLPGNQIFEGNTLGGYNGDYTGATALDLADPSPLVACLPESGSVFPLGDTTITCKAKDVFNNETSGSFVVTVNDTTAPVVTVPTDITSEATGPSGAVVDFSTSASDIVDGTVATTCTSESGSIFSLGTTPVSCTASDLSGNSDTMSFIVTVLDTTAPEVIVPGNTILEAVGPEGTGASFKALAKDKVDGDIAPTCTPASGSIFPIGTTTVSCAATDAAGNTGSAAFSITVRDTTPPIVSVPANKTLEATSVNGAVATFDASALDSVDGAVAVTCTPASGSTYKLGESPVSCTATDTHGNTGSASFIVTVVDTTQPAVTAPDDMQLEATSSEGAIATFSAFAVDIVDGKIATSCAPASGSTFALGSTTVTCSAKDAAGNTGSDTFTVTVVDTTPPVVTVPPNTEVEAVGPTGTGVTFVTTAIDQVDGSVKTTCDPASGSMFGLGDTTINCSSTDTHGNTGYASFVITVVDTTPPTVTVPENKTLEATGPSGAVANFSVSAVDLVDGYVATTCNPDSGSTFALGMTEVICTAEDAHGNLASAKFAITVRDTTPPAVTVPAGVTEEATGPNGTSVSFTTSAFDIVDGAVATTCTPESGSTFKLGETPVSCSATDAAGNIGSASFKITVQDTTAPEVTVPANMTLEATGASGAIATFSASAQDIVDGNLVPSCSPASGSMFPIGVTNVECSAKDAAGNSGLASFKVTVQDTTAPILSIPNDFTLEATGPDGAVVTFTASAKDIVDGNVTTTCTPASGSIFPIETTTVSCLATDEHKNTGSASFKVTVQDTTAPVVTVPANMTIEATGASGAVATFSASAKDIVDGAVTATCNPVSGSTFSIGSTTVSCSATDAHNNTALASFKVTVQDTTPPALTVPVGINQEASGPTGTIVTFSASAYDIVDGNLAPSCSPASGSLFPLGVTAVNCSVTDAHGNTASKNFTVTVNVRISGFYQPVDMTPVGGTTVWNTVKNGSTVPLKFEVFGGNYEFTSTSIVSAFAKQVTCNAGKEDTIEVLATGNTSLRYDLTAGQFIYNWKTPAYSGKCYSVTMTTTEGSYITAYFMLK